jgi:hypothetical protein
VQAAHAYALARRGQAGDVAVLLQSLEPVALDESLSLEMAQIHAALANFDKAFQWLNAAFEQKSPGRADIAVDPLFDPLRADARFAPLLQSIGLKPLPRNGAGADPASD